MSAYENAKIYKLYSKKLPVDKRYFGSTTMKYVSARKALYKKQLKDYKDGKGEWFPYLEIVEQDDFVLKIIEVYSCKNAKELKERVDEWAKLNKCMNIIEDIEEDTDDLIRPFGKIDE